MTPDENADEDGALAGDVALVTGASSGIGRATAEALAAAGADVALAARRTGRLEEIASEIEHAHGDDGVSAEPITTDVTDRDEVEQMVDATRDALGGLDVLVNNAGVMLLAPVERAKLDELERMIDVNLKGLMTATRYALPGMLEQGGGDVVNVSSVAGLRATENSGGYAATKFGVNAFSESLRKETAGTGVRVTRIEPGAVATELATHITDEEVIEGLMERFGDVETLRPGDVAEQIRWAVTRPPRVSVNEIVVRPSEQEA